ncbi:MAG: acyl-ACP desaturase, partial [Ferruginibacter sp.]
KIGECFGHFCDGGQRLGVYTAMDYTNILETLIQEWKIAELTNLNSAAEKGRDYLMKLPERFKRIAERGLKPSLAYEFNWIYR